MSSIWRAAMSRRADYAMKHTGTEIINLGTGHGYSVLDICKSV